MPNYKQVAEELKTLVGKLGVSKKELQDIVDRGAAAPSFEKKLEEVDKALARVRELSSTTLTDVEKQRKMVQMESDMELLSIIIDTSPVYEERLKAQREKARISAALGTYKAQGVLRIEDLLDEDENEIRVILAEAAKDIAARQNLQRVLKGVEVLLRVTVFSATMTSKLALAAA